MTDLEHAYIPDAELDELALVRRETVKLCLWAAQQAVHEFFHDQAAEICANLFKRITAIDTPEKKPQDRSTP